MNWTALRGVILNLKRLFAGVTDLVLFELEQAPWSVIKQTSDVI